MWSRRSPRRPPRQTHPAARKSTAAGAAGRKEGERERGRRGRETGPLVSPLLDAGAAAVAVFRPYAADARSGLQSRGTKRRRRREGRGREGGRERALQQRAREARAGQPSVCVSPLWDVDGRPGPRTVCSVAGGAARPARPSLPPRSLHAAAAARRRHGRLWSRGGNNAARESEREREGESNVSSRLRCVCPSARPLSRGCSEAPRRTLRRGAVRAGRRSGRMRTRRGRRRARQRRSVFFITFLAPRRYCLASLRRARAFSLRPPLRIQPLRRCVGAGPLVLWQKKKGGGEAKTGASPPPLMGVPFAPFPARPSYLLRGGAGLPPPPPPRARFMSSCTAAAAGERGGGRRCSARRPLLFSWRVLHDKQSLLSLLRLHNGPLFPRARACCDPHAAAAVCAASAQSGEAEKELEARGEAHA